MGKQVMTDFLMMLLKPMTNENMKINKKERKYKFFFKTKLIS